MYSMSSANRSSLPGASFSSPRFNYFWEQVGPSCMNDDKPPASPFWPAYSGHLPVKQHTGRSVKSLSPSMSLVYLRIIRDP